MIKPGLGGSKKLGIKKGSLSSLSVTHWFHWNLLRIMGKPVIREGVLSNHQDITPDIINTTNIH